MIELDRLPVAEIDHSARRVVLIVLVLPLDRNPVLKRDVRAEYVEDVCLANGGDIDVVVRIIVGRQRPSLWVLPMVLLGETDDRGVVVNHRRIAGGQVAPEDPFAAQQRLWKRTVDFADEDLVIATTGAGENQR